MIVYFLAKIEGTLLRRMHSHRCFFDHQHFLSSPTLIYVVRVIFVLLGYHSAELRVPFRYLNIIFTASM